METEIKKIGYEGSQKAAGEITVVCCYCQKTMEIKKGNGVSGVSHGICYTCFIKTRDLWRKEIEAYQEKWIKKSTPEKP
jgi:hypothetical protein